MKRARKCTECGTPIPEYSATCINDYCQSTARERRAKELGASIGTGIGMAINLGCLMLFLAALVGGLYGLYLLVNR